VYSVSDWVIRGEEKFTVFHRLKLYDWTFSATAETVVGALLAVVIVACLIS
jgi:hypothetical protein